MKYLIFASQYLGRLCAVVVMAGSSALAMNDESLSKEVYVTPIVPGICFSQQAAYQLSSLEKSNLTARLQRLTGWPQLRIGEGDRLMLEQANEFAGGSVWARRVINEIFRSGNRFVVENHAGSATVNFGQLDEGTNYADDRTGTKLVIYRVRLDFDDFQKMQASPEVRDTFDEGFTFFHELLHGLGLQDTNIYNEIGDCERVVNQIRAELGLPLRDHYLGDLLNITPRFKTVRLRFKSQSSNGKPATRWKKQYLYFVFNTAQEWEPRPPVAPQSRESKEKLLTSLSE